MAVMAKWGTKTWEISSDKVITLEGLTFSYTQAADENRSTEDKKTTNQRGYELFPLSFTTRLVEGTGVDIRKEIQSWKELVTKANYFYLNGKKLHPKLLQLRQVSVSDVKTDNAGRMKTATLSFTFKEYDPDTSSVKADTSALKVTADSGSKNAKKTTNSKVAKSPEKGIKVGSYVKLTGSEYTTGEKITEKEKQRSYTVKKISGDKLLVSLPDGKTQWVKKNDVTLTK